jgi:general secretion pathway protein C
MLSFTAGRRAFQALALTLIAIAAYLQARGLSHLFGAAPLRNVPPTPRPPSPPAATASANSTPRASVASASSPGAALPPPPLAWPLCDGVQVSIVTESTDPWWSIATLRERGEARAHNRRVGDASGGRRVAFIGWNPRAMAAAVWLESREAPCQALLQAQPAVPPSDTVGSPRGDTRVSAERLKEPSLWRTIRVVPEQRNGVVVGIRLFGIRPNSLLTGIGLQNGDRLETVNGLSVATAESALLAYAQLQHAERLRVRLVRRGRPLELTLNIR